MVPNEIPQPSRSKDFIQFADTWMVRGEVNEVLAGSGERFDRVLFRIEKLKVSSRKIVTF